MTIRLFLTAFIILLVSTLVSVDQIKIFSPHLHESKKLFTNDQSQHSEVIPVDGAVGPESFAFDREGGGPYTGVSDGRIIKLLANESRWINFAVTSQERNGCEGSQDHTWTEDICGRPLGLCFNERTGDLYIADAYMGLLAVRPNGGLAKPVAKQAQGISFAFTNSLDIDQSSGLIYFTDSSTKYQRRNYVSVIVSGDNSGRLLKFDPRTNEVTVLLGNLMFPNGVSLSKNGDFLLLAETTNCRILKFWLEPSKAGIVEVIAELPGFPDNIKRNQKGEFWVGINSRRGTFLKWILSFPWIRNGLIKVPFDITSAYSYLADLFGSGLAIRLSENGDVLELLEDQTGKIWKYASEVDEENGNLWIGSVKMPYAVKISG